MNTINYRTMPPNIQCRNCEYFYKLVDIIENGIIKKKWRCLSMNSWAGEMFVCHHPELFKSLTKPNWGCIHYLPLSDISCRTNTEI